MRKTIYCKDQSIWDSVKRKAGDQGLSISQFLLGLNMRDERPPPGQLDRIESKLDAHINSKIPDSDVGDSATKFDRIMDIPQTPADRIRDKMDDEDFGNEGMSDDDPGGDMDP